MKNSIVSLHLVSGETVVGEVYFSDAKYVTLFRPMKFYAINPALSIYYESTHLSMLKYNPISHDEYVTFKDSTIISSNILFEEAVKWYKLNAKFVYEDILEANRKDIANSIPDIEKMNNELREMMNKPVEPTHDAIPKNWAELANTNIKN
jgi:hypothetical protein